MNHGHMRQFCGQIHSLLRKIFSVEPPDCIFSSSETTSTNMSGLKEGNYHSRQLTPCSEIIHAWWEPIWNINEVFTLEDYSQRTLAKCADISAWAFPGAGKWKPDCSEGLCLLPHLPHPLIYHLVVWQYVMQHLRDTGSEACHHYFSCRLVFPRVTGQDRCIQETLVWTEVPT